jgi:hypothetical protein
MYRIVAVLMASLLLVGCASKSGKPGVVAGTITYKGQAVNGAALLLYPSSGEVTNPITIPVTQEGTFSIADVPSGEYKIVVEGTAGAQQAPPIAMKNMPPEKAAEMKEKLAKMNTPATIRFPDKYKDPRKTDLKCKISESDQKLNLELTD